MPPLQPRIVISNSTNETDIMTPVYIAVGVTAGTLIIVPIILISLALCIICCFVMIALKHQKPKKIKEPEEQPSINESARNLIEDLED